MLVFSKKKFKEIFGLEKYKDQKSWVDKIDGKPLIDLGLDGWGMCYHKKVGFYVHSSWCKEVE